ncbi:MAG: hypothetical protein M3481_09030 [Actinomycetota bacterium]|nr:hypothetical protein [Actinomycetota bacterium]
MDPFSPRLLQIDNDAPLTLKPVLFEGRVDELALERWIVENPDLVGEPLLVLGHQLAEFEEDKDRLDILALDRSGEIVLVELKVSEDFRVTDLQALAYAGAYAKRRSRDLALTLQRHLQKRANAEAQEAPPGVGGNGVDAAVSDSPTVSFENAAAKIAAFIEVDDFTEWQPSQQVRIKLVAPSFPRRVLQTVKWLGDVHSVRLEAITVRLFETAPEKYSIAFERLLPLPAEEDFDMTVRERENRQRAENTSRRPAVLPLLVNEGRLQHDEKLWVTKTVLQAEDRDRWDPDSPVFQVRVHAPGGASPKLAWRASDDEPEEILSPSAIAYRVFCAVVPGWTKEFSSPVAPSFSLSPGGKTLEDLALEEGLWASPDVAS